VRVLDVAGGRGGTALLLAREYGAVVTGVDLSAANVAVAAAAAGLADRDRLGDAEALPLPAGGVDVVMCECAFCTFPDKPTAATEFARVLRPVGASE
jgi:arsenite methyltransferase